MIYQKTDLRSLFEYASYQVGNSNGITVQFDFQFPVTFPSLLKPLLSSIELYDTSYNLLNSINGAVDIPKSPLNVNFPNINEYYLLFQTNFQIVGDVNDREKLEEMLRKCKTTYSINGGDQGKTIYTLFDSVYISKDKMELYLFKQINLKK
jgi:hypothetical protein